MKNLRPFYLQDKDYPAIIIYPQCPDTPWIDVHSRVKGIIDYAKSNYNVDSNRIALTGFSWGGSGAWEIALQYPTIFSCVVPVSGYSSKKASKYPDCPVWAIGSTGDSTNGYAESIGSLLKKAGKKVKVTIYKEQHGYMQPKAYTSTLINWMIQRSKLTNASYKFP